MPISHRTRGGFRSSRSRLASSLSCPRPSVRCGTGLRPCQKSDGLLRSINQIRQLQGDSAALCSVTTPLSRSISRHKNNNLHMKTESSAMPPSRVARAHVPTAPTAKLTTVSTLDEFKALVAADAPTIVKFTATWCGPCHRIAPLFAQLSQAHNSVQCAEVDVDEAQDVTSAAGVRAMPTFQMWVAGQIAYAFEGAKEEDLNMLFQRAVERTVGGKSGKRA